MVLALLLRGLPAVASAQVAGPACASVAALISGDEAEVHVTRDTVVQDPRGDTRWRGCRVALDMPRADVADSNAPDHRVRRGLAVLGWRELLNYAADGPNGTAFALRKEGVVCFIRASWGDRPTSTYTLSASCAVP